MLPEARLVLFADNKVFPTETPHIQCLDGEWLHLHYYIIDKTYTEVP